MAARGHGSSRSRPAGSTALPDFRHSAAGIGASRWAASHR
jgi:hypothetical protein